MGDSRGLSVRTVASFSSRSPIRHDDLMLRRFRQVDVFGSASYRGNPLAVVVDGAGLSTDEMQQFANWTNLSETTFLSDPTHPDADYAIRIFTTTRELPFAGHPTLGSCQVWLDEGGASKACDAVVQECGAGQVKIRRDGSRLAFAAPPLVRSGPPEPELRSRVEQTLGVDVVDLVDVAWVDNGPGWVAARVASAEHVLALEPDFGGTLDLKLGVVGPIDDDADADFEVRAFFPGPGYMAEDPVTGSLNASLAQWLMADDPDLTSYVARQGTALGRDGRVHVERDDHGTIWIGGAVTTAITGTVDL
jgi:PhzF family phenazine biosynthesis protein